jgi:hypothetical protein
MTKIPQIIISTPPQPRTHDKNPLRFIVHMCYLLAVILSTYTLSLEITGLFRGFIYACGISTLSNTERTAPNTTTKQMSVIGTPKYSNFSLTPFLRTKIGVVSRKKVFLYKTNHARRRSNLTNHRVDGIFSQINDW